MGKISPLKRQINALVSVDVNTVIEARAFSLDMTNSKFASLLFKKWAEDGYPPLSKPDAATAPGVMEKLKKTAAAEKAAAANHSLNPLIQREKKEKGRGNLTVLVSKDPLNPEEILITHSGSKKPRHLRTGTPKKKK